MLVLLAALRRTQETRGLRPSASHRVGRHLQPLDNNGLETTHSEATAELFSALEMEGGGGGGVCGGEASLTGGHTPSLPPPTHHHQHLLFFFFTQRVKKQGQSPDTFPSNFHCRMCSFWGLMACHFAGAFGQELILESKQIFRGAIFHQVLIFLHSRSLYSLI